MDDIKRGLYMRAREELLGEFDGPGSTFICAELSAAINSMGGNPIADAEFDEHFPEFIAAFDERTYRQGASDSTPDSWFHVNSRESRIRLIDFLLTFR